MSTSFAVDLVFAAKGTREIEAATRKLGSFEGTARKLKGQNPFEGAERGARSAGDAADKAGRKIQNGMSGAISAVGKLAAAYGALRLAQGTIQAGIQRTESTRRLEQLASGYGEVAAAQAAAARAAQKFGISQTEANQSFAQIYARLRPIGTSLKDIETSYNGFNTAAKLSGASASEASSAWLQLSQALGSGVLRGEELNSVFEQTPGVVQAIAKEMNAPIGQIRQLAQDGKITSDIVIRALRRIETEGADKLAAAMKGPAQQVKNLENAFEDLKVEAADKGMPAIIAGVKLLTLTAKGLNGVLELTFGWLQSIANIDLSALNSGLDAVLRKGLAGDYSRRIGLAEAAGLLGLAPSQKADQLGALLREIQASPQRQNLGGAQAQLEAVRTIGRNLRGINAEANPSLNPRLEKLQGIVLQLEKTLSGTVTRLEKEAKTAPTPTPTPTPQLDKALNENTKATREIQRVIGGRTGGGQADASRGRSTGPHLHAQLVSGGNLERLVDAALNFGGGRTASSFGLGRGAASHGYNARDYYTPQGSAFTLNPGWSAQDLGIRGALGRGMRVSGPGGVFELGHLSGVTSGTGKDALSAEQDALNDLLQKEQQRLENLEKMRTSAAELLKSSQAQVVLAEQMNPLERERLQTAEDKRQVEVSYAERLAELEKLGGDAKVKATLEQAKQNELLAKDLELSNRLKELNEQAVGSIQEEIELLQAKLAGKEKEYLLQKQITALENAGVPGDQAAALVKQKDALEGQVKAVSDQKELWGQVYGVVSNELQGAIKGLIDGTTEWGDVLSNILSQLGSLFISSAFNGIGAGLKLPGYADGGRPDVGMPSIVGERGPELFVPDSAGTVIPNHQMGEAMRRYSPAAGGSGGAGGAAGSAGDSGAQPQITIQTGDIRRWDDGDYVRMDVFQAGLAKTAKEASAAGEARTLRRLQNSRATRSKLGM